MIAGLTYIPNFVTDEQQASIVDKIDACEWSNELKRRVQHYGYKYDYTLKTINESMKVQNLSKWMIDLGGTFVEKHLFEQIPDQVIINEYLPGQGIARHIDCRPCFQEIIASLSLLSECVMEFTSRDRQVIPLTLEPKSLLILKNEARYDWYHGIPARLKDNGKERTRRISATFRNVILER